MLPYLSRMVVLVGVIWLSWAPGAARAADGTVELSLADYQALAAASVPAEAAPRNDALSTAQVRVTVDGDGLVAEVTASLSVTVFEAQDTAVLLLPPGTALDAAQVGGSDVALAATPYGLVWRTAKAGRHAVVLTYRATVQQGAHGATLPLPLPLAPSVQLEATVAAPGLDITVVPGQAVRTSQEASRTVVRATLPQAGAAQIAWALPGEGGHTMSRATYVGQGTDTAVAWTASFDVQVRGKATERVPLVPRTVTLVSLSLDGRDAPILVEGDHFAADVSGAGRHTLVARFSTPIARGDGPPRVVLPTRQVPISRVTLTLPGDKEVTVSPAAAVTRRVRNGETESDLHVVMTDAVTLQWSEAVPEAQVEEVLANASLFHFAHAEEGVLYASAVVQYEVTRGETRAFLLELPADIQVNQVSAAEGGVADWRVSEGARPVLSVFLDRMVTGPFVFRVDYERLLPKGLDEDATASVPMPLLWADKVHRQRGMVALLAGKELALAPVAEDGVTRVGENQLPALVRNQITRTVAHTFKYVDPSPGLTVRPSAPDREVGRFNAIVDTLVSLGEVTMTGSASIGVDVKSGALQELVVSMPAGLNVLSVSAPSLREHNVAPGPDGDPAITLAFTQEMEGQFRIDVDYERITADASGELAVPTLTVVGAEVEQGRIAVEALTAVEVVASQVDNLSLLDADELPQQLLLRTTNPILLAYKYVQVTPPYALALTVTRHEELEVQAAAIDQARYRTLYTADGLAVTTATFTMRNSREQFLRVGLPAGAEVWSATVEGKAEKPALASGSSDQGPEVLIKIINSAQPFQVEMVYATPVPALGVFGRIAAQLPTPDIVVTQTQWEVYLPDDMRYGEPSGAMRVLDGGTPWQSDGADPMAARTPQAMQVQVPMTGVRFAFDKLYANQSDGQVGFTLPYASTWGGRFAWWLSFLGTLALVVGAGVHVVADHKVPARVAMGGGAAALVWTLGYLELGYGGAITVVVLGILGAVGWLAWSAMGAWRGRQVAQA